MKILYLFQLNRYFTKEFLDQKKLAWEPKKILFRTQVQEM